MREYTYTIRNVKGLLPFDLGPKNTRYLQVAKNIRAAEAGVSAVGAPSYFGSIPGGTSWPYPQIFSNQNLLLLLTGSEVWRVERGIVWTADLALSMSLRGGAIEYGIPWDWASIGDAVVLSNYARTLIIRPAPYTPNKCVFYVPHANYPRCLSLCEFNGQILYGGYYDPQKDLEKLDRVGWGVVGSLELNLYNGTAAAGTPSDPQTAWYGGNVKWSNEWGYLVMPQGGRVGDLLRLGDRVLAYTKDGVACLRPGDATAPWGVEWVDRNGVLFRNLVAGNDKVHYYVGTDGAVRRVTAGGRPELMGCREFTGIFKSCRDFTSTVGAVNPAVRCWNEGREEAWFGLGTSKRGLIVNRFGVTETGFGMSGMARVGNLSIGAVNGYFGELDKSAAVLSEAAGTAIEDLSGNLSIPDDPNIEDGLNWDLLDGGSLGELGEGVPGQTTLSHIVSTDTFDFGIRSLKTIYQIDLDVDIWDNYYVGIASSISPHDTMKIRKWILCNPNRPVVPCIVTGTDFCILIYAQNTTDFAVRSVTVRYKLIDLRGMHTWAQPMEVALDV